MRSHLDLCIPDRIVLRREAAAWQAQRNRDGITSGLALHHRSCTYQTEVSLPINTTLTDY